MAMATSPIRKKRNFRGLQLNVSEAPSSVQSAKEEPVAIRQPPPPVAPAASAPVERKKRPPPMIIKAPKIPNRDSGAVSAVEQDGNLLTVNAMPNVPHSASPAIRRNTYHTTLSNTLANLDMNAEIKFDLKDGDLKDLQELGQGNGGSVKKVEHVPTKTIMAKKIVLIDAKPSVRKQILRELQIMHDCHSKYIISFYGAFLADPNICICMEFMDKGSLDGIYKKIGPIDIDIVGKVALAVLEEIKICDFGVSGELINSIADTFVGTSTYMSPERIQGAQYTVKSDVESTSDDESDSDYEGTLSPARPGSISLSGLPPARIKKSKKDKKDKSKRKSKGVSLQGGAMTMSILELLQHIVNEPAPRLTPDGRYPKEAENFIDSCLLKDPDMRKTPKDLLKDAWIEQARTSTVDLEEWANTF
ncbi:kinase-like domain-containing protein [Gymnopilus junonius]|uniref:Kinase-like domain-containing protein n=1 Tax=Gymnopilus junonius TaxID=109634 RepID=A0A9P5NIP3_GYMJU|nr:kinase-like domain-containing protein [Gymnopilus junonius]